MDFLGFGGWEIFLIIRVALLVYGPARMVTIARSLGKIANNFRKVTSDFSNQIVKEMDEKKRSDELKKIAGEMEDRK